MVDAAGSGPEEGLPLSAPWQEPVRHDQSGPALLQRSGREQLQAILDGEVPPPPLARLTGTTLVAIADGTATFRLPLTRWLASSAGLIPLGMLAVPADAGLGCAILTALPAKAAFSTSELSLRLLAPVRPGGILTATGRVIQVRRTVAVAEVTLTDQDDRLIGHGSTLCLVQRPNPASPGADGASAAGAAAHGNTLAPYLRPAPGTVLDEAVWRSRSGLEVLQAQLDGALPLPPLHHLTGITPEAVAPGEAEVSMPASEGFCAPEGGRVQGGFVAALAEAALSAAILSRVPAGTAVAPVDLKVNYLRPLRADGRRARARAEVAHLGRRVAVARAEVRDGEDRVIALASGSALLLPGREASLRSGSP